MITLGVNGGHKREYEDDPVGFARHDAAAILLRDGVPIAAIEEERLSRIKHSNCFPFRAIQRCLEICGVQAKGVDLIALNTAREMADAEDCLAMLADPELKRPAGTPRFATLLNEALKGDVRSKVRYCGHHLAHAWSAFIPSGLDDSLVLSIDGDGDNCSGMILSGEGGTKLRPLRTFSVPQSLGNLYNNLISLLGYSRFDEYKVMALAPYGDSKVYESVLGQCYQLLPDGNYSLAEPITCFLALHDAGLLASIRRKGEEFSQVHMNFAASLQAALEKIVLHILRFYRRVTNHRNLCMAGGVAHNSSLNGKVHYSQLFERVFVQPAAHDAGGALGAAIWASCEAQPKARRWRLTDLYLGSPIGSEQKVVQALSAWKAYVTVRQSESAIAETAKLMAEGNIIGWAQGRAEFGPRALGNRSILADPRPAGNKARINEMVKKREEYRPFAPSVLEESVEEYFEIPNGTTSFPFMTHVLTVREKARPLLGAVTHVDGTARVQTVSKSTNPLFWELIKEFDRLTGVPILLNTSFNNNAEPIVDSIDDAVTCFLTTGINHLVIDRYIVTKPAHISSDSVLRLIPMVPLSRKLLCRCVGCPGLQSTMVFELESTKSFQFGARYARVSSQAYTVLQRADGKKSLSMLMEEVNMPYDQGGESLVGEILDLWTRRLVVLRPSGCACSSTRPAGFVA
jgi:carbamoyltransferase